MNRQEYLTWLEKQAGQRVMGWSSSHPAGWSAGKRKWIDQNGKRIWDWHPCSNRAQADQLVSQTLKRKELLHFQVLEDYYGDEREYGACFIDRHYERGLVCWDKEICPAIVWAVLDGHGLVVPEWGGTRWDESS